MANCNYATTLSANRQLIGRWSNELKVIQIGILCNIKNFLESGTPMPACNFATLVSENKELIGRWEGELDVIMTGLLCDISAALPGWSGVNVLQFGAADPNVSGALAANGAIYLQTVGGVPTTTWYWNATAGEWQ